MDQKKVLKEYIQPLVQVGQSPIAMHQRKPSYGIKYPVLKSIAKEILKSNPLAFLESNDFSLYELEIIQTYVIGGLKNINQALEYFEEFLNIAKEWSLIDSLAQKFTITQKHPDLVFEMLKKHSNSNDEFKERMICVMGLSHFMSEPYLDAIMTLIHGLEHPGYYAKMGKAWAIAEYMVKAPEKALKYLHNNQLDAWTYQKAIQKMLESNRIPETLKHDIRELKKITP